MDRALARTAPLWPEVERAYAWLHSAAHVLGNPQGKSAALVRRRLAGLLGRSRGIRHERRLARRSPTAEI